MAKLVLVNAGTNYEYGVHEPLHLLVLAAYAIKEGHKVAIADQIAGENIFKKIQHLNPDFVGITGTTAVIADSYEIASWCKKKGFKTILGGVHVSVMPEEALQYGDYVVKGEGEDALAKILAGDAEKGLVVGEFMRDLDALPKINRDLINMKYYQKSKDRTPGTHVHFAPTSTKLSAIMGTRGCPFNCIFCHNSWRGLPVRLNSAQHIFEEMMELQEKYGTESVFFMDDDLLCSKRRVFEFCELYKKSSLKIVWGCQARVSMIDRDIMKALRSANCRQIMFGFESGNQRILSLVKNHITTLEQNVNAIKLVKEAGVLACGNFMIGNPTETEKEILETKRFILENDLDGFGVTISTPFPGTKLWQMCEEKGVIPEKIDWRKFNLSNHTLNLSNVSPARLQEIWNDLLNLSLERNSGMAPKNLIRSAIKHPRKAVNRVLTNPRYIKTFMKRIISNRQEL